MSPRPAPLLSEVVPAKVTGPVMVMLLLVVDMALAREIALDVMAMAPVVVILALTVEEELLTTVREVGGIVAPTAPPNETVPVPAVIDKALAPLIVEEKAMFPAPAPVVSVVVPPPVSDTAPVREILLSVVVKAALAREIAVDVMEIAPATDAAEEKLVDEPLTTVKLSGTMLPPTVPPKETVPVPAVIETVLFPLKVLEKLTLPAPAPVVKVLVPPPLNETAPTKAMLLLVVVKATLGIVIVLAVIEMAPVVVTAAAKLVVIKFVVVSEARGVVPPIAALNVTVPAPAATLRDSAPLIVEENEALPTPLPVSRVAPGAARVTGPVNVILLFVVARSFEREIALEVIAMAPTVVMSAPTVAEELLTTVREVGGVEPPTAPLNETVPVPAVIERTFAPLIVEEKEIFPAPAPVVTAVVPLPVRETAPLKETLLDEVSTIVSGKEMELEVMLIAPLVLI